MKTIYKYFMPAMLCLCICTAHAQTGNRLFTSLEGNGTKELPYLIGNTDDLILVQKTVASSQEASKDKYFKLTADIRLNTAVLNDDGTLCADTARLQQWEPIGKGTNLQPFYAFQGHFDGDGHTISGIYINDSTRQDLGLFGCLHRGAVVSNLRIADSYVLGTGAVGAFAGQVYEGTIDRCESQATVVAVGATLQAGGIVGKVSGSDGRIGSCTNSGHVTSLSWEDAYGQRYNCDTGGICGSLGGARIDSCLNLGTVVAREWSSIGGISGSVSGGGRVRWSVNRGYVSSLVRADVGGIVGNNWQTISYCRNEGQVVATVKGSAIGGIAGICSWNSAVYDSENHAPITSDIDSVFVGGIAGNMNGHRDGTYYTPKMYRCANYAAIVTTQPKSQAGGISGRNYLAEIHDCTNYGAVSSASLAGGITPSAEYHSAIKGCGNTGTVEGMKATGGIVGDTNESIDDCWNSGRIANLSDSYYAGGIAGYTSGTVCGCVNTGEVCNTPCGGGIAGYNNYRSVVRECYNAGYVHSDKASAWVAGIGGGNGTLQNCYNAGIVAVSGDNGIVSGLAIDLWNAGSQWAEMRNCYNMGRIRSTGRGCKAGSLVGQTGYVGRIMNCYALTGAIEGNGYTDADRNRSGLTMLSVGDFASLADRLNVGDFFFNDPLPFVQGYYRPVLQCTRNLPQPHYFDVTTLQGDSARIDLGLPCDNTLFTTTATGQVLDACNVLASDTVRRLVLTDAKDFAATASFVAVTLQYERRLDCTASTVCLPFAVDSADLPTGAHMLLPHQLNDAHVVVSEETGQAQAGQPFLLQTEEDGLSWNIVKRDAFVVPVPSNEEGLLKGVFLRTAEWQDGCYLPDSTGTAFYPATANDTLTAFRAYIQVSVDGTDALIIPTGIHIAQTATEGAAKPSITAGRHLIVVDNAAGRTVRVYTTSGHLVGSVSVASQHEAIAVPAKGLYVVAIDGAGTKVRVP